MLEIKDLKKKYHITKNAIEPISALDGVSLTLSKTGLIGIVGRSGCGKTSLLNIIGGIDTQTDGDILFDGVSIKSYSRSALYSYRSNIVSYVFQDYNLLTDFSVIDNIKLACRMQGMTEDETNIRSLEALRLLNLEGLSKRRVNSLSGGQQQRIAIARAIAKDSKIILCDEPTGNLDSKTANEIYSLLSDLAKERLVIVVSHDKDFAINFADRIITMQDGKIVSDDINERSEIKLDENSTNAIQDNAGLKQATKILKHRISLRDTFLIIKNNYIKTLFVNIIVTILLAATISLSVVFSSLSLYSEDDALVNTLKDNDYYVLQLSKYIDSRTSEYNELTDEIEYYNGPALAYEKSDISDIDGLRKLTGSNANYYTSYFFDKNLQDFTDTSIYTYGRGFQFYANSFREIIAVDDYSTFHLNLVYGKLPSAPDEVLIYDYMANNFLFYGLISGDIAHIIDKQFVDVYTGLSFTISGVIESDYKRYENLSANDNTFIETYLTSLQVLYCYPAFVDSVLLENDYNSLYNVYFSNDNTLKTYNTNIKKMKNININETSFLATIDDYENTRGAIVNVTTVASVLGIAKEDVDKEVASEFISTFHAYTLDSFYHKSIERSYNISYSRLILGVVPDETDESLLYYYTPNEDDNNRLNGSFRQIYLSLTTNWKTNKEVLKNFKFVRESEDFYLANPNYYFEGYTDYTPYGLLIQDADYYLVDVKSFANIIELILIFISVIGVFFLAVLLISKYRYKIGILMSMGASNAHLVLIFGLHIVFMALFSFILSIPASYAVMDYINSIFVSKINSDLVFFAITPIAQILVLTITLVTVIISSSLPLLLLFFSSPISIIKKNNRK
ncbi:MAG: ABC transporter ATP-binding protein/permease [Christensenellaceae bacterium]|jgi:ABC-type lipoprotein export system ATPase subunit|nr:ABC transporter ATP-binding protein/permease [Christensenellaceae bacterium]